MASIRKINPVKLFVAVQLSGADPTPRAGKLLEDAMVSEYGAVDRHLSAASVDGSLHRVLISFKRLSEFHRLEDFTRWTHSIAKAFDAVAEPGFLENHRVVLITRVSTPDRVDLGNGIFGRIPLQFRNGVVQVLPEAEAAFRSPPQLDFFLAMRDIYRNQLRSVCLLRR